MGSKYRFLLWVFEENEPEAQGTSADNRRSRGPTDRTSHEQDQQAPRDGRHEAVRAALGLAALCTRSVPVCSETNGRAECRSMMSDFEVHLPDESSTSDLNVKFLGPADSTWAAAVLVDGGGWLMHPRQLQRRMRAARGRSM